MRSAASVSAIPYCLRKLEVADVVQRHRARRLSLRAPPLDEARQREVEEIVPRQDDELVALQLCRLDREPEISDRAEPIVVGARTVVEDRDAVRLGPLLEGGCEAAVRDEVDLVHVPRPRGQRRAPSRASVARRPGADAWARRPSAAAGGSRSPPRGSRTSRQRLLVRRAVDAVLGDDRRDQRGRRDVEGGIAGREAARQLGRVALLDRDPRAVGRCRGRASRSARRRRTGSRGGRRARRASMSRSCSPCPRSRRSGRRR